MKTSLSTSAQPIASVSIDPIWPVLDLPTLACAELEKDEMYPWMAKEMIPIYVNRSIQRGQTAAQKYGKDVNFKKLINRLLKERVQIGFVPRLGIQGSVRAEYHRRKRRIEISRHSIQQITSFFAEMGAQVPEEEVALLHLVHEWFHHLEETACGRTDRALPRVPHKRIGPLVLKKNVATTREIAAHAFTQAVLGLSWSPLLLDYLLTLRGQGFSITDIRSQFQQLKRKANALLHPPPPETSAEEKPDPPPQ